MFNYEFQITNYEKIKVRFSLNLTMKENILLGKSFAFSMRVVKAYKYLTEDLCFAQKKSELQEMS